MKRDQEVLAWPSTPLSGGPTYSESHFTQLHPVKGRLEWSFLQKKLFWPLASPACPVLFVEQSGINGGATFFFDNGKGKLFLVKNLKKKVQRKWIRVRWKGNKATASLVLLAKTPRPRAPVAEHTSNNLLRKYSLTVESIKSNGK